MAKQVANVTLQVCLAPGYWDYWKIANAIQGAGYSYRRIRNDFTPNAESAEV